MKPRLLLQELTREEAGASASRALVVLPVGAIEQHGPHLPVGTDTLTIEHIARTAATEASMEIPVLVAPTLPFGSSHHHLPFGGTMSLSTETLYRVLWDLAESLILSGFRCIFILNGHGGNNEIIRLVARDVALKHPAHLAAASYWAIAWDTLVQEKAHQRGRLPGHAGAFETSQMKALRPDLVRNPLPHRTDVEGAEAGSSSEAYRIERHGYWQSIDGYTDSPDGASDTLGEAYLAAVIRAVARSLVSFYRSTT